MVWQQSARKAFRRAWHVIAKLDASTVKRRNALRKRLMDDLRPSTPREHITLRVMLCVWDHFHLPTSRTVRQRFLLAFVRNFVAPYSVLAPRRRFEWSERDHATLIDFVLPFMERGFKLHLYKFASERPAAALRWVCTEMRRHDADVSFYLHGYTALVQTGVLSVLVHGERCLPLEIAQRVAQFVSLNVTPARPLPIPFPVIRSSNKHELRARLTALVDAIDDQSPAYLSRYLTNLARAYAPRRVA